ncbi:MAG: type III secretion system export apparatus subunit SctT [Janthinobacterium lividum]
MTPPGLALPDAPSARMLLDLVPGVMQWLLAFAFALARPLALVSLLPVFSRVGVAGPVRGAIAAVLCLPALPALNQAIASSGASAIVLLLLSLKEAALGTALGLLLGVPFWALEIGGDLLDLQRGATQGRVDDPAGFGDASISGTFLLVLGITLFASSGGLEVVADCLYRSWRIWPPLAPLPAMGAATPALLLGLLDQMLRQAVRLVAPVMLAMLLADVSLILVGRVAPGLRIDNQALAVRNLAFYLFLPLYAAFLLFYMRQDMSQLRLGLDALSDVLPGAAP